MKHRIKYSVYIITGLIILSSICFIVYKTIKPKDNLYYETSSLETNAPKASEMILLGDAYIKGDNVNFRKNPSLKSDVYYQFINGAQIEVLSKYKKAVINNSTNYWCKIKDYKNKTNGYIFGDFISILRPLPTESKTPIDRFFFAATKWSWYNIPVNEFDCVNISISLSFLDDHNVKYEYRREVHPKPGSEGGESDVISETYKSTYKIKSSEVIINIKKLGEYTFGLCNYDGKKDILFPSPYNFYIKNTGIYITEKDLNKIYLKETDSMPYEYEDRQETINTEQTIKDSKQTNESIRLLKRLFQDKKN